MSAVVDSSKVDAHRVPVYPVLRLELRDVADRVEGLVDGLVVAHGERDIVSAAVLSAAASAAARRPGQAIRARLDGFSEGLEAVITAAGQLIVAPVDPPRRTRLRSRRGTALGVAFLVAVGGATAGLTWVATRSGWSLGSRPAAVASSPAPQPTQMPVAVPPGWSPVAAWSRPLGTSSPAAIASAAGLVFTPSEDSGAVVALNDHTGSQVWSSSLPGAVMGSNLTGGPVVIAGGGHALVVAWSSSQLVAWEPASGHRVGVWSLPSDASGVITTGAGVLVQGQGQHIGVLAAGRLQWRVLAAGSSAVGSTSTGDLIAAGAGQAWRTVSDRVAGAGVTLPAPAHLPWAGAVGVAGEDLVAAYSASPDTVVLRAFSTSSWLPVWTSSPVPAAQFGSSDGSATSLPLWVSPSARWGLYGSSWLDLSTGAVKPLPADWSTSAIGTAVAFGTTTGGVGTVTSAGGVSVPAADVGSATTPTAPAAVTDAGMALVVAADGSTTSLYAVPRAGGQ